MCRPKIDFRAVVIAVEYLIIMKKKSIHNFIKCSLAIGTAISLFCTLPMSVLADPTTEAKKAEQNQKEQELKQQIAENQNQLNQVNSEMGNLQNQQNAVNSQISSLNSQITELMTGINILESDIQITENEIYETNLELEAAIKRENEQYEATKTRIRCMYEQGETNYVDLLVTSSSLSEFLSNAEYIEKVYQYDQNLLNDYQETKHQVQQLKEDLEIREQDLEAEKEDLEEQKAELDTKVSGLRAIAADYDAQIASARRKAEAYANQIKQKNAEIRQIEAQRAALLKEEQAKAQAAAQTASGGTSTSTNTTVNTNTGGGPGGTAIMTGNIVSAGPNAKFHGAQYQVDVGVITSAPGSERGKEVAMYAIQFLGNPYVHAGRSLITGTDCSGFTSLVYKHFGINISPGVAYQKNEGRHVDASDLQPGDVIIYPGHAALYIGSGKIIHASSSATGIKISNWNYRQFSDIRRML